MDRGATFSILPSFRHRPQIYTGARINKRGRRAEPIDRLFHSLEGYKENPAASGGRETVKKKCDLQTMQYYITFLSIERKALLSAACLVQGLKIRPSLSFVLLGLRNERTVFFGITGHLSNRLNLGGACTHTPSTCLLNTLEARESRVMTNWRLRWMHSEISTLSKYYRTKGTSQIRENGTQTENIDRLYVVSFFLPRSLLSLYDSHFLI